MGFVYDIVGVCGGDLLEIEVEDSAGLFEILWVFGFSPVKHPLLLSSLSWEEIQFGLTERVLEES